MHQNNDMKPKNILPSMAAGLPLPFGAHRQRSLPSKERKLSTSGCKANPKLHSWLLGFVALWATTLPWPVETTLAQGSTIYIEPGPANDALPERTLTSTLGRGRLFIQFSIPGVLQTTSDLALNRWTGVAMESPYVIPAQELLGNRFFRVQSAERPLGLFVPSGYDPSIPAPLVILLHGFEHSGAGLENDYVHILPMAEEYGFAYCYPDGTKNSNAHRFWNATGACCNFHHSDVDDVGYLKGLIDTAKEQVNIDPRRVFLIGYSNGAFMAHRMAIEHSQVVAGVACLAGTVSEGDSVNPQEPVNVLQVHGTEDEVIFYGGGITYLNDGGGSVYRADVPFVGAEEVVAAWGAANGCTDWVKDAARSLDLSYGLGFPDTIVARFSDHPANGVVELWSIQGGKHYPEPRPEMWRLMIEWLLAHPKQ